MSKRASREIIPKTIVRDLLLSCLTLAVLVTLVPTVYATNITVNTTVDDFTNNGNCTLREAIVSANNDGGRDSCPAGNGDDVIMIPRGTYNLTISGNGATRGDLDISQNVTIQGDGADITVINGGGVDRIFDIAADVTAAISDVTITGGLTSEDGGGIRNLGNLTITRGAIDGNMTSGTGNSGGIQNGRANPFPAMLLIEDSTISNNTSSDTAGGIQNGNGATLVMINSTISGNTAASDAGGINNNGIIDLNNVTITNNTATGSNGGGHI